MESSSIKINSISIDLANEIDTVKCDHFSIRGFAAKTREKNLKKCKESIGLLDNDDLPPLTVPKFRWWRCMSCIKDIGSDGGTKDCGMHSNSEKKLDETSSVIPFKSKWHSLTAQTDIVADNENVNRRRSHKDDRTAAMFLKKVHPRSTDASSVKSKSRKLASSEQVGNNKRSREKVKKPSTDQAVTMFGLSEIAGVVEDTPNKNDHKGSRNVATEGMNLLGNKRRKTRKVRLLSELLRKAKTKTVGSNSIVRKEESSSKRGRKRKLLTENNYVSRILSTNGATSETKSFDSDQGGDSESTDSGFDRDPIKGKQKNRRFQIVDEVLPSVPSETSLEKFAATGKEKDSIPCTLSTQRTEKKLGVFKKKKKTKTAVNTGKSTLISFSPGMDEGNAVKPLLNGPFLNAISQSTRDLLNEKRAVGGGGLFDDGYYRKYIQDKPVVSLHLSSRGGETNLRDFGSSFAGRWLGSGRDVVDFRSNNTTTRSNFPNFETRYTSSSSNASDLSRTLQKDVCGADRKGKTVMVQEHRKENTPEDQNDDIPMEIVELMAKNQYERCLPDKEDDKQTPQEPVHKSKNALLIDLNETYDNNGITLEDNNNSASRPPPKPCDSNARKDEHFAIGKQQKSLEFFPLRQPYAPSSPYFPPQENRASSSSVQFLGQKTQNCGWLGNGPTMASQNPSPPGFRILRACNTCQSVPHQFGGDPSYPFWSSRVPTKPVSDKMNQFGMLSKPSNNQNTWNLNFDATNRKQTCGGSNSEFSFGCKHATAVNSSRPADESSIPALHLLSLMDPRLRSNSPADHHEKTTSTNRPFWSVSKSKESTTAYADHRESPFWPVSNSAGDTSKTAYATKNSPFDFYGTRFAPETSRNSFAIGTPSLSFQNGQASWSSHHQQTQRKDMFAPVQNSHEKPNHNNNNNQGKFQLLGASNSMMLPLKFHLTDKEKKQKRKAESCNNNASMWPLNNGSGPIVCNVNRNPADFTIPEPGNVYMLTGESLKVRKRTTFKRKPSLCKQDVLKQTKKQVGPFTENA